MKLLILILVLAISTQPLRAGACDMDMEKNQETSHHMAHSDQDSDQNSHDCCDTNDADQQDKCDGGMNCGFCLANGFAIPGLIKISPSWGNHYSPALSTGVNLPSHSSPPFRPPIA